MLTTWDAVSTLDRMLDDVMGSTLGTATNTRPYDPSIDLRANEDEVLFVLDVPGMKAEDLDVTLENHVLAISGTRRFESKENEHVMLGRSYGSFRRAFTLPESLDDTNVSATLVDGVLTIRVPKHPKAKPRKIEIGSAANGNQLPSDSER